MLDVFSNLNDPIILFYDLLMCLDTFQMANRRG